MTKEKRCNICNKLVKYCDCCHNINNVDCEICPFYVGQKCDYLYLRDTKYEQELFNEKQELTKKIGGLL